LKTFAKVVLLWIILEFPLAAHAQKNCFSIELGGGMNNIVSKAIQEQISKHAQFSLGNKVPFSKKFFSSFSIGILKVNQANILSSYFDKNYNETIHFNANFEQAHLISNLSIGRQFKYLSLSVGVTFKWLMSSNLQMEPVGTYNSTIMANINNTYKRIDYRQTAPFNDFNYAPNFRIEVPIYKHLSLAYQFSYDLEINPKYELISNYNTYYHTLLINLNK
jgi:hypothetical protein